MRSVPIIRRLRPLLSLQVDVHVGATWAGAGAAGHSWNCLSGGEVADELVFAFELISILSYLFGERTGKSVVVVHVDHLGLLSIFWLLVYHVTMYIFVLPRLRS